jgi:hypothetical protein
MCVQSQPNRLVVTMKAYFDGSGKSRDDALVLTGVAAMDRVWKEFGNGWRAMLAKSDERPAATFLHTVDLLAGASPYSRDEGWGKAEHWKLLWDCLIYAQGLDKTNFKVFTCAIDMKAHRELRKNGHTLPNPYAICCRFCSEVILKWYLENFESNYRTDPDIQFLFDRGERHKGVFERKWIANKKMRHGLANHWHLIKEVGTVFVEEYPPVQLADLISWQHNRRLRADSYPDDEQKQIGKDFWKVSDAVLPFRRVEMNKDRLLRLAAYSGLIPNTVIAEFGDFENLSD